MIRQLCKAFTIVLTPIVSGLLGLLCGYNLLVIFGGLLTALSQHAVFFFVGTVLSLFAVSKFRKRLVFFTTFEHELTHNIWALLFFRKPVGFHVYAKGHGKFSHRPGGTFSDLMICLSPYFFPTACYLWLPFHLICKEELLGTYFLVMGIFFGYQIMSTIHETGTHQTDITTHGILYSFSIFVPLYIVFHGVILAHLAGGWTGIANFLILDALNSGRSLLALMGWN